MSVQDLVTEVEQALVEGERLDEARLLLCMGCVVGLFEVGGAEEI